MYLTLVSDKYTSNWLGGYGIAFGWHWWYKTHFQFKGNQKKIKIPRHIFQEIQLRKTRILLTPFSATIVWISAGKVSFLVHPYSTTFWNRYVITKNKNRVIQELVYWFGRTDQVLRESRTQLRMHHHFWFSKFPLVQESTT